MSKTTIALEAAVAAVIAQMPKAECVSTARQRRNVDVAFGAILKLIAPRIRHFIRQYGLGSHWEDAEQCCAIAVHRAIIGYDPTKAQFTTFISWQIRGELQSLRFRLMTDQRPSAKKVDAITVSLHALTSNSDGDEATLESVIEDECALARTEAGASNYLALAATASLIDGYVDQQRAAGIEQLRKRPRSKRALHAGPVDQAGTMPRQSRTRGLCPVELEKLEQKLARDKEIVERRVFDVATLDELGTDTGVTKERVRQITKRATRSIVELAAAHPRFAMMAEYRETEAPTVRARTATTVTTTSILPALGQPHNLLSQVVAIVPLVGLPAISLRQDAFPQDVLPNSMSAYTGRTKGNASGNRTR
ncbi:sigma factor-like helix-turn-helix DNA-binding protein [Sphingomonas sp. PAMC 26621]|uniref:sigma factor-like helix-turn-helix DNA-binding protein n=1 Tax=Sphingomonas sp. PAMC 26621 TaxID=1112213 RepID=UPI000687C35B|nr:sigma factor-like helix-turn-helix DNA-binding protein [Sphingomonas sp. PAMC 26621]